MPYLCVLGRFRKGINQRVRLVNLLLEARRPQFESPRDVEAKKKMAKRGRSNGNSGPYAKRYKGKQPVQQAVAAAVRRQLAKTQELKHLDVAISATVTNTASVVHLNTIAQGDSGINRDGRTVMMKSIELIMEAEQHAAATHTFMNVKLVRKKNNNSVALVAGDIYDGTGSAQTNKLRELDQAFNYEVLADWYMNFTSTGHATWQKRFYKGLRPDQGKCSFQVGQTSGAATVQESNGLYLLLSSNQASSSPAFRANTRVRFTDA